MVHEITLTGYTAGHADDCLLFLGTADSYGAEKLHITADEAWDGLTVTATFVRDRGRTRVLMDADGFIAVPQEATALDGGGYIGRIVFAGVKSGMQRLSTDLVYRIIPHANAEGSEPQPTPAEWAQFIAAVADDRTAAQTAAEDAQKISERFSALADEADIVQNLLGFTRGADSTTLLTAAQTYTARYIAPSGSLAAIGDANFIVKEFPVRMGRRYHIYSVSPTRLMGDYPIAGFKATPGTDGVCAVIQQGSSAAKDYDFTYIPAEDGCIFIAAHMQSYSLRVAEVTIASASLGRIDALEKAAEKTLWTGRKVVWLGSSVPFGQYAGKSYAAEAAQALGFTLVNASVPGLALHTGADGNKLPFGSLCLSKAEYAAQGLTLPAAPAAYTPGGAYNDFYRSYENIFTDENADADLYVFDLVPNTTRWDTADWDGFDFSNWRYTDGSSFSSHRTTFLGALLFLLDKLYALNPEARVVFVLGSPFEYEPGKTALGLLREKWNMPVLDLWGQINTSPKSLQKLKAENGTNPHPSAFAHTLMGRMLAGGLTTIA